MPLPRAAAIPQLLVVLALGIACFAALGIAISAAIPTADSAGAVTNGTYLPLAMVSGMFSASLQLPAALDSIISAFPLKALADGLRSTYDPASHGLPLGDTAVLLVWTVAGIAPGPTVLPLEPLASRRSEDDAGPAARHQRDGAALLRVLTSARGSELAALDDRPDHDLHLERREAGAETPADARRRTGST